MAKADEAGKRGRPKLPARAKRSKSLQVSVTPDLDLKLRRLARKRGRTLSDYLNEMLSAVATIDVADVPRLAAYCRVLRAAVERAGENPAMWSAYAKVVPFPLNPDVAPFAVEAERAVKDAVDAYLDELNRQLEQAEGAGRKFFEIERDRILKGRANLARKERS